MSDSASTKKIKTPGLAGVKLKRKPSIEKISVSAGVGSVDKIGSSSEVLTVYLVTGH